MRLRPRSFRARLTLWYASALALILVLYAGSVFLYLQHSLYKSLDGRLRLDLVDAKKDLVVSDVGIQTREDFLAELTGVWGDSELVEVWSEEGELLLVNPPRLELLPADGDVPEQEGFESLDFPERGVWRRLVGRFVVDSTLPVVIRVSRSEKVLRSELRELLLVLLVGLPVAVAIAGVGGYILARRFLSPLALMSRRAAAITAENLSERLPVENESDELGQLALVFNATFARLDRSFSELRRFTGDASHELRTPLTVLRSVGEVSLAEERSGERYRETIGSMLEEVDRMSRLVDSLLTLSRAEGVRVRIEREPSDLAEFARELAADLSILAEERGQSIAVDAGGPVVLGVDPHVLRHAVVNLLHNAIRHGPPDSIIHVRVDGNHDAAWIEVEDEGAAIREEDRERIFERFYRIDKGRSREEGGTGLGLAIARWAAKAHGGDITYESEEGRGRFIIRLPR